MLIENNTLLEIDQQDVIDGVFTAPDDVLYVGDYLKCESAIKMILPNVRVIGLNFLSNNENLEYLEMPMIDEIGHNFLFYNKKIEYLDIPRVSVIGYNFLFMNTKFKYTINIIKALMGNLYIDGGDVDKREYIRKLKLKKIV